MSFLLPEQLEELSRFAFWPRFGVAGYQWDYNQTASGLSHFSDQLERQKRWSGTFAVFEMFYCEFPFGKQPPFLDDHGSSCIWHEDAEAFRARRADPDDVWSQSELQTMLQQKHANIVHVMIQFGECKKGRAIRMVEPEAIGREFQLPQRLLAITAALKRNARRKYK
jgi:hypothetical protein